MPVGKCAWMIKPGLVWYKMPLISGNEFSLIRRNEPSLVPGNEFPLIGGNKLPLVPWNELPLIGGNKLSFIWRNEFAFSHT